MNPWRVAIYRFAPQNCQTPSGMEVAAGYDLAQIFPLQTVIG